MYKIESLCLKDHNLSLISNIDGQEDPLVFIVQDGDMFKKEENNIKAKLGHRFDNIIVLALDPINRFAEYSPWPEDEFREELPFTGKGDQYLSFLMEDLIGFLEDKFSLEIKASNVFLAGASLGGLISIYGAFEYPELGGFISVSSSLWYDNFIDYIEKSQKYNPEQLAYIDVGDAEGKGAVNHYMDVVTISQHLYSVLMEKGFKEENILFIVQENMQHRITYFIDRIYDGISYIYSKKRQ